MSSFRMCLEVCNPARSSAVPTSNSFGNSDRASEGPLENRKAEMRFYGTAFQPPSATAVVFAGETYYGLGGWCVFVLRQVRARAEQPGGRIHDNGGLW